MATVSIIVPIYNAEDNLKSCLNSIINQTFGDLEIILVNDGSTDMSGSICDEYGKFDERIKVIHTKNSGVSVARNTGLQRVSTPFLLFVDADDNIDRKLVECLLEDQSKGDFDFVMSGYQKVYLQSQKVKCIETIQCKKYKGDMKEFLENIEWYVEIPLLQGPCWKLFKTSIIKENNIIFPPSMSYGEDAMFVYNYLSFVKTLSAINQELYKYNIYNNETLSKEFRDDKFKINSLLNQKLKELLKSYNIVGKEEFFIKMNYRNYNSFLSELWRTNQHMTYKEKINCISDANKTAKHGNLFHSNNKIDIKYQIISYLASRNRIKGLYMFFSFKESMRRMVRKV